MDIHVSLAFLSRQQYLYHIIPEFSRLPYSLKSGLTLTALMPSRLSRHPVV
jgi:hypothetical protein